LLNRVGAIATAYVASATTCQILGSLKEFAGTSATSNRTLLQADPTSKTKYQVDGTPLYWVPEGVIDDGTIWALDQSKALVVMRQDVELITTPFGSGFNNDLVSIRAILRAGFAWPHEAAVVKITGTVPGS
jgi:HK97 family phage major capsid protein